MTERDAKPPKKDRPKSAPARPAMPPRTSPPSNRTSKPPESTSPGSLGPRRISTASMRVPSIDFELASSARRIVSGALGLVAGEKLVTIVDRSRHELGLTLFEVARALGARAALMVMEDLGDRPLRRVPDALRAELETAQASILVAGFEEGEQAMRLELVVELVRKLNLRHGHMIGVSRQSMLTGFSVDPSRILDATRSVRTRLRPDSTLRLRTTAGSDLEVKLNPSHKWMEHVGVIRPGRWENLPTGEIVTAVSDVKGAFVCDASMGGHFGQSAGLLASHPVRLEIDGGVVKSVRCENLSLQLDLERFTRSERNADRVGAVGLGTNVGIYAPIGDVSCDQNMPGLHLGLGSTFADQTGATWDSRAQLTLTSAYGDVDLDGAALLRRGRYVLT